MICVDYECDKCIHHKKGLLDGWKVCCDAFPEGIPPKWAISRKSNHVTICNNNIGYEAETDRIGWGELNFLNPSEGFEKQIVDYLIDNKFVVDSSNSMATVYKKDKTLLWFRSHEDCFGQYILISIANVNLYRMRELLSDCPECGSKRIKPCMPHMWRNEETDKLYDEGKLDYLGAYERPGTFPPLKECLECGCEWHNSADVRYWSDIYKSGRSLTKKDLGILY